MHRIRFFSSLLFLGEVLNQLGEICRNHFACALQRGTKLKVCVSANVFDLHAGVVQRVKVYHRHISGTRDQIENPNRGRVGLIGQLEAGFVVSGIEVIVGVAHEHLIEIGRSLGVRDIGGDSRKVQTPCGGEGVVGVKKVDAKDIHKYGSLKVEHMHDNVFACTDMKEKPQTPEEVLSLYSILDRCVLPAEIFEILENTKPGIGGEIQLTDAMREIAITKGMTAVEFEGKRYDMGNKFGILQAQIEIGLEHPETKDLLKDYIKNLAKTL